MVRRKSSISFLDREYRIRLEKPGFSMPLFRILLVEDFAPFRQFVSSIFDERSDFQVIGEVTDGDRLAILFQREITLRQIGYDLSVLVAYRGQYIYDFHFYGNGWSLLRLGLGFRIGTLLSARKHGSEQQKYTHPFKAHEKFDAHISRQQSKGL